MPPVSYCRSLIPWLSCQYTLGSEDIFSTFINANLIMPLLRLKPLATVIAFGVNSAWISSWQAPPCFPSGPYPLPCCWNLFYVRVVGMVPCIQPGFHSLSHWWSSLHQAENPRRYGRFRDSVWLPCSSGLRNREFSTLTYSFFPVLFNKHLLVTGYKDTT